MNSITVFCGSSLGRNRFYKEGTVLLGKELAKQKITLVYGGARVGLMGILADSVLANGGEAIGVIPKFLVEKEIAHKQLTELLLVDTMHDRKAKMNDLCDGVIALPGGFGTMEELFEMLTWAQLGLHQKAIGILNIDGYYDHLIDLLDRMVEEGLLKMINRKMLIESKNSSDLINKMCAYRAPLVDKWITQQKT